ncbi:hypothetical protein LshimejAT787_0400500 [Lyophyllum shimeji]|uniref:Uncharacterized protein n=1 Tax=Lyophyllum shimeji TaxID=47721 RepID=A0A9P3UJI3_LYOSH|nr:hypothetical protein LshimejAT787_0400500 [Lyophyllum shimeji]
MPRAFSFLRDALLPLIVFPGLIAFGIRFIFGHLFESGLSEALGSACIPGASTATSYHLPYTGLEAVDAALCPFVAFFHAALDEPDAVALLTYFIGTAGSLIVIPAVEGWRAGRSAFLAYPVIFGLLSQVISIGITFPIYWLVFILSGGANMTRGKISQAHAEAIMFGAIAGATIPSVGLLALRDPVVTAIWQPYPAYVSLAQSAHLAFRSASKRSESGYKTTQFMYIGMLILCSSTHIATIWPLFTDFDTIRRVYIPSVVAPAPSVSAGVRVLHFLKWDMGFGLASSIIATLWFARNLKEVIALAAWNVIAIPVIGPGAALIGAALWRESKFQDTSDVKIKKK